MDEKKSWSSMWPTRVDNIFTEKMTGVVTYTAENEIIHIIDWRAGFSLLLVVMAAIFILPICLYLLNEQKKSK